MLECTGVELVCARMTLRCTRVHWNGTGMALVWHQNAFGSVECTRAALKYSGMELEWQRMC